MICPLSSVLCQNLVENMKRTLPIFLFCFILLVPIAAAVSTVTAQGPNADSLAVLEVTFWPDFDKPQVLVLMAGTLPPGTELPATITIPLPADAELNAVARVTNEGMFDDIEYTNENGSLSIISTEPRFLVEYYQPYEVVGSDHSFTFDWSTPDLSIDQIIPRIQQPAAASTLSTSPPATDISPGQFGLTYHEITNQPVAAGEDFSLTFRYPQVEQLTVNFLDETGTVDDTATSAGLSTGVAPPTISESSTPTWIWVLGIVGLVLVVAAVTWTFATRNQTSRPNKKPIRARPVNRSKKAAGKKFCHNCGQALATNGRFCPNCGTKQK